MKVTESGGRYEVANFHIQLTRAEVQRLAKRGRIRHIRGDGSAFTVTVVKTIRPDHETGEQP